MPREELFVVSKVAAEHKTYESAAKSIDETLEKMGLDYLDMMIIHSPQPWVEVNQSENRYVEGNRAAWKALEEAYEAGKLKAIGISNFQMGIVVGPKINTAFLEAGLLNEISLLVGAGIDGRGGMPAVFDGLTMEHDVTKLKLIDVKKFDSDAVWIRYRC